MKKIATLTFTFAALASGAFAQSCPTLDGAYAQNFDTAATPALPQCTTGNGWVTGSGPGTTLPTTTLQYEATSQPADAWFFTPGINLVAGVPYKVTYKYMKTGTGSESFSTTYGLSADAAGATVLYTVPNLTDETLHNASLSFFTVTTTGTYYMGLHATSAANQGNIYIDDFNIEPTACGIPQNPLVYEISQTAATFSWGLPAGGNVNPIGMYEYAVTTSATPPASGTTFFNTVVSLSNLQPATTYYAHTRAMCGGSLWGDWTTTTFSTTGCAIPQNLTVSNVNPMGVILNWDAVTSGSEVNFYQYTITPDNEAPTAGPVTTTTQGGAYAALTPGTTYQAHIRSFCSGVWSDWDSVTFTTPLCTTPTTVPYLLDFSYTDAPTLPECTSSYGEAGSPTWIPAVAPGNGFDTQVLQFTGNTTAANAWFYTRGVQLEAGVRYKISYTYGNSSEDTTENLRVVMTQTPGALTTEVPTELAVTGATPATNSTDYVMVNEAGVYYWGFQVYSPANQGSIYIDNFSIEENVCGQPAAVTVTDITETSATVNWAVPTDGNSPVLVYMYGIGTADTPPATPDFVPGFTEPLTDLEPNTTYYVYTGTLCGPIVSEWVVTEFTTAGTNSTQNNTFKNLSVYPNPVTDVLTVDNTTGIDLIRVYSITGQLLLQQEVNNTSARIPATTLPAGVYLLQVTKGEEKQSVKFIVK